MVPYLLSQLRRLPKSVCTSINEVVCHGIPKKEDVLKEGDIINVDFTTILDGYYADASRMFIIGKTTPEKEQLVRVAKEVWRLEQRLPSPMALLATSDTPSLNTRTSIITVWFSMKFGSSLTHFCKLYRNEVFNPEKL